MVFHPSPSCPPQLPESPLAHHHHDPDIARRLPGNSNCNATSVKTPHRSSKRSLRKILAPAGRICSLHRPCVPHGEIHGEIFTACHGCFFPAPEEIRPPPVR